MIEVDFHDDDEKDLNGGEEGDKQRPRGGCFFFFLNYFFLCYDIFLSCELFLSL